MRIRTKNASSLINTTNNPCLPELKIEDDSIMKSED